MLDREDLKDLGRGFLELGKMSFLAVGIVGGFIGAAGGIGWTTYGLVAETTDVLGITDPGSMAQWSTDFHFWPQTGHEKFHDATFQAVAGLGEFVGIVISLGLLAKLGSFAMEIGADARMSDRIKREQKDN